MVLGSLDSDSPFTAVSPAVSIGDIWVLELDTDPEDLPLSALSDGTASYSGSTLAQHWRNKIYDVSLGAYYATDEAGDYFTIYVNDQAVVETAQIEDQQAYTNVVWEGPILDDFVDEPEGEEIAYDFSLGDGLPTGVTVETVVLNAGEPNERTVKRIRGTPATGQQGAYDLVPRATDVAGNQTPLSGFLLTVDIGVQVPTVDTGSTTLADALDDITAEDLITLDIVAEDNAATVGNVFDQDPEGGTWVAPGSGVVLFVSGITTPGITGDQSEDAEIEVTGLGLGYSASFQRTSGYETGTVISQQPAEGTVLLPGDIVTALVARSYPISTVKTITRKRF